MQCNPNFPCWVSHKNKGRGLNLTFHHFQLELSQYGDKSHNILSVGELLSRHTLFRRIRTAKSVSVTISVMTI